MIRVILAILCLLIMVGQVSAGMKMIEANNNMPPEVSSFDNLENGATITGALTKIDGEFVGDNVLNAETPRYLIVLTERDHIMVIRVLPRSEMERQVQRLQQGFVDKVVFKGRVSPMTDTNVGALNMYLLSSNYLHKMGLPNEPQRIMLRQQIDITTVTDTFSNKVVVFTFVGAVLMFLLALVFLRNFFKNLWYNYLVSKGLVEDIHLLDKKDFTFEDEGLYTGAEENNGEFFVNTEHNVRDEGSLEEQNNDMMTHFTADGDFFYEGGVNDEGNFYVDEQTSAMTVNGKSDDPNSLLKKY